MFEITGDAGRLLTLSLTDGTAEVDADGNPILDGTEDYGPDLCTSMQLPTVVQVDSFLTPARLPFPQAASCWFAQPLSMTP